MESLDNDVSEDMLDVCVDGSAGYVGVVKALGFHPV
jgi:hypothetical protein